MAKDLSSFLKIFSDINKLVASIKREYLTAEATTMGTEN
jgi:hypothetical protein